jgi:hypothetical protein
MALNKQHPEKRDNERFLTNATIESFATITFKTKRMGLIAYTINGDPTKELLYPVFITEAEFDKFMNNGFISM